MNKNDPGFKPMLIIASLLFCYFLYDKYKKRNLDSNARYIYGNFFEISRRKSGRLFHYVYSVGGKSFKGDFSGIGNEFRKEDLVLIKYQSTDPKIHVAMINYNFYRNINVKDLPLNGWDTLPRAIIFRRL